MKTCGAMPCGSVRSICPTSCPCSKRSTKRRLLRRESGEIKACFVSVLAAHGAYALESIYTCASACLHCSVMSNTTVLTSRMSFLHYHKQQRMQLANRVGVEADIHGKLEIPKDLLVFLITEAFERESELCKF